MTSTIEGGVSPPKPRRGRHSLDAVQQPAPSIERLPGREASLQHRAGVRAAPENMSKTLDLITASSDASALEYLMRFCNGRRISDPSPRNLNWQEGFFGMILRVQIATYHA